MIWVYLSDDEYSRIVEIATERMDNKMKVSPDLRKISSKPSLQVHIEGIASEYAVAKALHLRHDDSTTARGDGGWGDLTLPDGRTVQVKYNSQRGGDFALRTDRMTDFMDDIGILVYPRNSRDIQSGLQIVGWMTRQDFERRSSVRNYGYGDRLAYSPHDLRPMTGLVNDISRQWKDRPTYGSLDRIPDRGVLYLASPQSTGRL